MRNIQIQSKKLIFCFLATFFVTSLLAACSNSRSLNSNIDQSELPWSIQVLKWETAQDLKGSQSIQQYNGDVTQLQFNDSPKEGYTFLLIDLIITKQTRGSTIFHWNDLTIVDGKGNSYSRMDNDTFLKNYNFPRLKSTDLTLGTNKGFVCFEIPSDNSDGDLILLYKSEGMTLEIPLTK